jgi:type IV pilus assembly protein PilX
MRPVPKFTSRVRPRQQGVVLIYALITLVIMLIGAVAISRSISANQFNVGNIGFKRDLTNQGERAALAALDAVRGAGVLADETIRTKSKIAANYSATILPTNAHGIPTALLSDAAFAAVGTTANDITVPNMRVTVRYVIDRLATAEGECSSSTCTMAGGAPQTFGGAAAKNSTLTPPEQAVYRLTLRVTGPRNTLSFYQSTFTTD